jgi:hypothetical protein
MNGYGSGAFMATGIGQMAYTGVNALGMSLLAAGLLFAGLILLRLSAARRASQSQRHH